MIKRLFAVVLLAAAFAYSPFAAARYGYDYYHNDAPRKLLRNVEKYHLKPGEQKMNRGDYVYAMGDAKFMLRYFPNDPKALRLAMEISLRWPGHETDAEPWFEKAIHAFPQYGETYLIYGVYLHRRGKMERAVTEYKKAIDRDPNLADAHYNLGLALLELGRLREANEEAHRAYALKYPLPGLRNELQSRGAWVPVEQGKK